MKKAYIVMHSYLQKKLPLDRPLIRDLTSLDPANKYEHWTVNAIEINELSFT